MQESTELPIAQPITDEVQRDPANTARSGNEDSAPQNPVPANFVEIVQMPKPDSADKEEPTTGQMEDEIEEMADETEGVPTLKTISQGEQQMMNGGTPYQKDQETPKKDPLPSEKIYAAMRKAFERGDIAKTNELVFEYSRTSNAEKQAERLAQMRTEAEQQATYDDSADEEHEEYFAESKQSEPQPDEFKVNVGGSPAKTAGLKIEDLIRVDGAIKAARYASPEDGLINQFCHNISLPSDPHSLYEPLFGSLILPSGVQQFGTTRALFDDISALLYKQVMLPTKDCSLLAYWSIATWFTKCLNFVPSVVISGPASTADVLLHTLVAVCRRPLLLGELNPTILRKLPIYPIQPTLLVREPQLNRHMSALLNASNQPGYLFLSGQTLQQLYCPKCIYIGESFKDAPAPTNSIHINLSGTELRPDRSLPKADEIASFQNRLFSYRLLNYDQVASTEYSFSGFRPEMSTVAGELGAAIVADDELRQGIIEALKDRDEQVRVDRSTGVDGLVVRAVLFHCHQRDQHRFVREIAAATNRLYAEDGESLKVSPETVGHVLKRLGLYSRRLGNAGRGLVFDKATQTHAHRLGQEYDVLTVERTCTYCHELQQAQSEEVVQVG